MVACPKSLALLIQSCVCSSVPLFVRVSFCRKGLYVARLYVGSEYRFRTRLMRLSVIEYFLKKYNIAYVLE